MTNIAITNLNDADRDNWADIVITGLDGGTLSPASDTRSATRVAAKTAPSTANATEISALVVAGATANDDILFGTPDADLINGLAGNDTISGLAGDDIINGGPGADTMHGNAGNDTFFVDNAGDVVIELTGEGATDRVATSTTYTLAKRVDVELFTTTSSGGTRAINLTGNERAQTIIGNAGANVITDGLGAGDLLRGLGGNDTYIVRNAATRIIESGSQGSNDRLAASTSYTLARGVDIELLTTTSSAGTMAINLTGNERAQTIIGNAAANVITDGAGAGDLLRGLGGNDTYIVKNAATDIIESGSQGTSDRLAASISYTLGRGVDIELFTTTSSTGTAKINLTGNERAQTIVGNAGDNILTDGLGAADLLRGQGGNDTYIVRNTRTTIIDREGQGDSDRLAVSASYTLARGLDIELFTTTSSAGTDNLKLTGNELAQTIIGNAGDNMITDGLGAADVLRGLGGNDTYVVMNKATRIVEGIGQGSNDTLLIGSTHYTLDAGVDIDVFTHIRPDFSHTINMTGNELSQTIIGSFGDNIIKDGGGAGDILRGSRGNDTYIVKSAATRVIEEAHEGDQDAVVVTASHTLESGSSIELFGTTRDKGTKAINLTANDEIQIVSGNFGNNRIDSKGGSDIVGGLDGRDTFIFSSALGRENVDIIVDYTVADDQIALDKAIFSAITQASGTNLRARFFEANAQGVADDANDRIIYNTTSGELFYDPDGDGNAAAQQFALMFSDLALTSNEFEIL